jgi:hypothetical protein
MNTRWPIYLGCALVASGAFIYLLLGQAADDGASSPHTSTNGAPGSGVAARNGAGQDPSIKPRDADSASAIAEWSADEAKLAKLREMALGASNFQGALQDDYATFGVLDGWVDGYATGDEYGDAIMDCRDKYIAKVGQCLTAQRMVLERQSDGTGKVAYTSTRPSNADPSPDCVSYASCVGEAWRGRTSPWPGGLDEDYLAVNNSVFRPLEPLATNAETLAAYKEELPMALEALEGAKALIDEHGQVPALLHSVATGEARIEDMRRMIEHLS